MDMAQTATRSALVVGPDAGEALWFGPNRMTIKAGAADTEGAYALLEAWAPAGSAPPMHVHRDADEAFYVLAGELTILCGDEEYRAGPGSFALLPRGVPHSFVVEGGLDAHLLTLLSPGASEAFFRDAGIPAGGPGLPPPAMPDIPALARAGMAHGIEILGPPPRPRG
jgi:mannose-6-phosphate isomerase-like protein (cupin superfamily)